MASTFLLAACSDDVSGTVDTEASSSDGADDDGPSTNTITVTSADSTVSESSGPSTVDTTADTTVDTSSSESATDPDESSSADGTTTVGESSSTDTPAESSSSTTDTSFCGDGVADDDEVCDTDDVAGESCISLDFDGGVLGCQPGCNAFDTSNCFSFSCGNDVIEGAEFCDGADLAGETCVSQDFDAGTLACARDCSGYDTSNCISFSCGNGAIEGAETCDGLDLAGSDCLTLGFDGGALACAGNCTYDTTACFFFSCGNDTIEGAESCDGTDLAGQDCLTQGFDGGTLGCIDDCSGFDLSGCFLNTCGNDTLEGAEPCDGSDLAGEDCITQGFDAGTLACLDDCTAFDTSGCVDFICGDGTIQGTEQCDGASLGGQSCVGMGFAGGTLACTAGCALDSTGCFPTFAEIEPNDDGVLGVGVNDFSAANANGPFAADTFIHAAINPVGDDDVFAVTNPGPGFASMRLETFGPGGVGTCVAIDTVIEVRTAANALIVSNDESGIGSCSLLTGLSLAPGETQYVRVIDFQDNTAIASYFLEIQLDPVVCGDAIAGPGEFCDDGNVVDGDGCSSTCTVEAAIAEIEPNATPAQADAAGIVVSGDAIVSGSIGAVADLDVFRVEVAAPQIVRFETFSSLGRCPSITTNLRLFDSLGAPVIADTAGLGISGCAAITFPLAAGTYYAQVEETGNNATIATYLLEVAFQGDQGTEAEPNETLATANTNLQLAGSDVYVFGDHTLNVDSDFYAIDVPAGSSLRLEAIEGDRAVETCEGNGIDSRITLFNAAGVQLVDDDDEGRGFCSIIDGTGDTPLDGAAHNLPAGTYYVQVRASSFSQAGVAGQFIYRLVATVRTP